MSSISIYILNLSKLVGTYVIIYTSDANYLRSLCCISHLNRRHAKDNVEEFWIAPKNSQNEFIRLKNINFWYGRF